jgi:hypothetical protein
VFIKRLIIILVHFNVSLIFNINNKFVSAIAKFVFHSYSLSADSVHGTEHARSVAGLSPQRQCRGQRLSPYLVPLGCSARTWLSAGQLALCGRPSGHDLRNASFPQLPSSSSSIIIWWDPHTFLLATCLLPHNNMSIRFQLFLSAVLLYHILTILNNFAFTVTPMFASLDTATSNLRKQQFFCL